jgi:hypothetical protein
MRKSEQICARVTPEVMTTLRTLPAAHSMLLSDFIRQTLAEQVSRLTSGIASEDIGLGQRKPEGPFQHHYR